MRAKPLLPLLNLVFIPKRKSEPSRLRNDVVKGRMQENGTTVYIKSKRDVEKGGFEYYCNTVMKVLKTVTTTGRNVNVTNK